MTARRTIIRVGWGGRFRAMSITRTAYPLPLPWDIRPTSREIHRPITIEGNPAFFIASRPPRARHDEVGKVMSIHVQGSRQAGEYRPQLGRR